MRAPAASHSSYEGQTKLFVEDSKIAISAPDNCCWPQGLHLLGHDANIGRVAAIAWRPASRLLAWEPALVFAAKAFLRPCTETSNKGRKSSQHGVETSAHEPTSRCEPTKKMQPNQSHRFCIAPMMDWNESASDSMT